MNPTVAFVSVFAVVCVFVTGLAIFRIWRIEDYPNKPLWILGCLLGFVGFSVNPGSGDDVLMSFGIQIPMVHGKWSSTAGLSLKAMFPVIAAVALSRLPPSTAEDQPVD